MKLSNASGNTNNTKLVALFTFLFITNILCAYDKRIGITLCVIEIIILLFYLLKGSIKNYVLSFILFLITSIEVSRFIFGFENESRIVYNFFRLPVFNMYHFYLLALLPLILIARENKFKSFFKKISAFKNIRMLARTHLLLIILGFISACICILLNDNKATYHYVFWDILLDEIIEFGMLFLVVFYLAYLITTRKDFYETLEHFLTCILLSIVPSGFIMAILGIWGHYGNSDELKLVTPLPLVAFFGVMLIVFPFYKQYQSKKMWFIYGLMLLILMTIYPSPLGGKWWLVVFTIPIVIVSVYFKNMTVIKLLVLCSIVIILVLIWIGIFVINPKMDTTIRFSNIVSQNKFNQATQTLFFWEKHWYDNLASSPKFRFEEFINIIYEYLEKPQYLFFGKGFGGSMTQHMTTLDWSGEGAFTFEQFQAGIFIRLHESANIMFLKFGLFGLFFFLRILFICFRNIRHNPWIVIGMIWFFFYFGRYMSLYFGLCCLVLGLYKVEIEKKRFNKYLQK